jgi:transposase-like protein
MSDHGEQGRKPPRRRSLTPELKAEIVELCQRGDRSVGPVTRDFDLTEPAVREWSEAGRARQRRPGEVVRRARLLSRGASAL